MRIDGERPRVSPEDSMSWLIRKRHEVPGNGTRYRKWASIAALSNHPGFRPDSSASAIKGQIVKNQSPLPPTRGGTLPTSRKIEGALECRCLLHDPSTQGTPDFLGTFGGGSRRSRPRPLPSFRLWGPRSRKLSLGSVAAGPARGRSGEAAPSDRVSRALRGSFPFPVGPVGK